VNLCFILCTFYTSLRKVNILLFIADEVKESESVQIVKCKALLLPSRHLVSCPSNIYDIPKRSVWARLVSHIGPSHSDRRE
jgi:hypothetical protein